MGLGMTRPDSGMGHLLVPQGGAELGGEILGAVVGDDARLGQARRKGLQGPLDDELDIGGGHGQAKIPEDNGPGIAIKDAEKEIMGSRRLMSAISRCHCSWGLLSCWNPCRDAFRPSGRVHLLDSPASLRPRKTVEGETATTPWSSIIYAKRVQPTMGCWRLNATIFSRSSGRIQCPLGTRPSGRGDLPSGPAMIGSGRKAQHRQGCLDGESCPRLEVYHGFDNLFCRLWGNVSSGERSPTVFLTADLPWRAPTQPIPASGSAPPFPESPDGAFFSAALSREKVCSIPSSACLAHWRINPGVLKPCFSPPLIPEEPFHVPWVPRFLIALSSSETLRRIPHSLEF